LAHFHLSVYHHFSLEVSKSDFSASCWPQCPHQRPPLWHLRHFTPLTLLTSRNRNFRLSITHLCLSHLYNQHVAATTLYFLLSAHTSSSSSSLLLPSSTSSLLLRPPTRSFSKPHVDTASFHQHGLHGTRSSHGRHHGDDQKTSDTGDRVENREGATCVGTAMHHSHGSTARQTQSKISHTSLQRNHRTPRQKTREI